MREKIEMVDLQPEQKKRTLNCMTKLYQSLEFFYQLVNDDKLSEENVRTHMGLYESYFKNCQICWDMIRQLLRSGEAAIQKSEHCGNSYGKVWQSKAKQFPQIC